MRFFSALIILFTLAVHAPAQVSNEKPPLRPGRISVQFVAAGLGGFFLTYGSVFVVNGISGSHGWDALGEALAISLVAYPVGSALGAHLAGTRDNETGNFWAALGGSAIGMGVSIFLVNQIDNSEIAWGFLILPPAGAVTGHVLTRHYKNPAGQALLNWENGQLLAGTPALKLQPVSESGRLLPTFRLLSVQF